MVEYTTIYLKFQDTSNNFSFYFYYHKETTIEDLLEYIINYFQEKKLCLCFQLHQMKNNNYYLIELNYNFKEYISINNRTFYIFIPKGNGCHCDQITKDNIKKSKKEIIEQLKDKENKLSNKEKQIEKFKNEIQILKQKNDKLEYEQAKKEKEIEKFKNEIQILKEKNDKLENENKDKKTIEEENIKFKNEIKELKAKEKNINKNLIEKEKEIEKFKNEIQNLQKDKQLLEIAINGDITTINQLKNLGVIGEYLKPKENIIKVDPKTNKIYN